MGAFLERVTSDELRIIRRAVYPNRRVQVSQDHGLNWQVVPFWTDGATDVLEAAGLCCFTVGYSLHRMPQVLFPGGSVRLPARFG